MLHGTDTMSYTAAALSFMLENLGKSVILTGSQVCGMTSFIQILIWGLKSGLFHTGFDLSSTTK